MPPSHATFSLVTTHLPWRIKSRTAEILGFFEVNGAAREASPVLTFVVRRGFQVDGVASACGCDEKQVISEDTRNDSATGKHKSAIILYVPSRRLPLPPSAREDEHGEDGTVYISDAQNETGTIKRPNKVITTLGNPLHRFHDTRSPQLALPSPPSSIPRQFSFVLGVF